MFEAATYTLSSYSTTMSHRKHNFQSATEHLKNEQPTSVETHRKL